MEDHSGKRRTIVVLSRTTAPLPESWVAEQNAHGHDVRLASSPREALAGLGQAGALRVLVEAGPTVTEAFERAQLWDERLTFIHRTDGDTVLRERRTCSPE
jgi:riboflavin biosynthesis pyrimidine reductase